MNFQEESNKQELVVTTSSEVAVELTPEYVLSQIVKLFNMLNNTNTDKGKRDSIRGIWNTLTNIPMPKVLGTQLRQELEDIGFIGGANGSISTFKNIEQYRSLIPYAIFSEDSFIVPRLNEADMNSTELKMYKDAIEMGELIPRESEWAKKLEELNLSVPSEYKPNNITIIGAELLNLEERKIDLPEVTNFLPEGVSLIKYHNTAYLYVTTPCALELTLKNIPLMGIDIVPIFYQTFNGGVSVDPKEFPPCEDFPEGAYFEFFPEKEMALAITTVEAYIALIQRGIYQRYSDLEGWANNPIHSNDYYLHINHYFLPCIIDSPTMKQITFSLEHSVLPIISALDDIELLEFIKKDLPKVLTVQGDEMIISTLNKRIAEIKT